MAESLLEAAEHPDARALYWAVYAEDTPVGFVMIADEVGSPDYIPHYLWKLLIDERYQRQGFGTATLDLIVEYSRGRPGVEVLSTRARQGDGSPITFYECYGFEHTGEVFDDEVLLRLRLRQPGLGSKRPVVSRSRSYGLLSGNGGNQDSRRTIQLS